MNTLNPKHTGATLASTFGILYVVCALLILLIPRETVVTFYNSLFHTIDFAQILSATPTFSGMLLGLLSTIVIGWLVGATYASIYNGLESYFKERGR